MKKTLGLNKAAKIAFVAVTILIAIVFLVAIARADYPCGFEEIHKICESSPEMLPGVKGVEVTMPDESGANPGGTVVLMAGEGKDMIGVGISIVDPQGNGIIAIAIYHSSSDHTNTVVNLLTGAGDEVLDTTVTEFIQTWLTIYNKGIGTEV
jgi:hypothetical protein